MTGFILLMLIVALDIVITKRLVKQAELDGRAAGVIAVLDLSLNASFEAAVRAADERRKAYADGKVAGRAQYQKELHELQAVMFKNAVPVGTKPVPIAPPFIPGVGDQQPTAPFVLHGPVCECNDCTWPKGRPIAGRCDCAVPDPCYNGQRCVGK